MRNIFIFAATIPISLVGCAGVFGGRTAGDVSRLQAEGYNCAQIAAEFSRLKGTHQALELLAKEKQCELGNGDANSANEMVLQDSSMTGKANYPASYPSYTLLASGAVVAGPSTVLTGASSIPVTPVSATAIFKKTRGDVCDRYVAEGDYCWWSPPGNYSMCPPMATFGECSAAYGRGCQLGHGKVLPLC